MGDVDGTRLGQVCEDMPSALVLVANKGYGPGPCQFDDEVMLGGRYPDDTRLVLLAGGGGGRGVREFDDEIVSGGRDPGSVQLTGDLLDDVEGTPAFTAAEFIGRNRQDIRFLPLRMSRVEK